jgi:hypothetical protein
MIYNFVAEEPNNGDTTPSAVGGTSYSGFEHHEKMAKTWVFGTDEEGIESN